MKLLIVILLILTGCAAPRYVVQETKLTIKNNRVWFKPSGPATPVTDTVMTVKMIRKL